jgi:sugar lactone lactonase YvrE
VLLAIPFASAAHADGCPPSICGTTSVAPPGSSLAYVFPNGRQGPLWVYDLRTGRKRVALPNGMLSANGRVFVAAVEGQRKTRFVRYDPRTGRAHTLRSVPGAWSVVGVSADGRRIARFKFRKRARGTTLTLDDPGRTSSVRFPGNYELESFSQDGRRLFLVHWHRTGSYDLQQYDRGSARLSPTKLDEPDEKMTGQAQGAVETRDGSWLYTLYWKLDGGTFVHALDLRTGVAHCIDLPLRGDIATIGATALTLSPDEGRLYLASPLAGSVTTVDLGTLEAVSTAHFRPVLSTNYLYGIGPSAAVSQNGRMLAFVSAHGLWVMDTAYGVVRGPTPVHQKLLGVGFTADGRRIVALGARHSSYFDAATGARVR